MHEINSHRFLLLLEQPNERTNERAKKCSFNNKSQPHRNALIVCETSHLSSRSSTIVFSLRESDSWKINLFQKPFSNSYASNRALQIGFKYLATIAKEKKIQKIRSEAFEQREKSKNWKINEFPSVGFSKFAETKTSSSLTKFETICLPTRARVIDFELEGKERRNVLRCITNCVCDSRQPNCRQIKNIPTKRK